MKQRRGLQVFYQPCLACFDVYAPPGCFSTLFDAIGPIEAKVAPLHQFRSANLCGQDQQRFVVEGFEVFFTVEKPKLPPLRRPGAGHAMEHLPGVTLATVTFVLGQARQPRLVGLFAPQPFRQVGIGYGHGDLGHAGLT